MAESRWVETSECIGNKYSIFWGYNIKTSQMIYMLLDGDKKTIKVNNEKYHTDSLVLVRYMASRMWLELTNALEFPNPDDDYLIKKITDKWDDVCYVLESITNYNNFEQNKELWKFSTVEDIQQYCNKYDLSCDSFQFVWDNNDSYLIGPVKTKDGKEYYSITSLISNQSFFETAFLWQLEKIIKYYDIHILNRVAFPLEEEKI